MSDRDEINYLDGDGLTWMVDNGVLAEINRVILHPIGLALEVDLEHATLRVWDDRGDPAGTHYAGEITAELLGEKRRRYQALVTERASARIATLGWVHQPTR